MTSRSMSILLACENYGFPGEIAVVTHNTASTISAVLVRPSNRPASCASLSPRGTIAQPARKRRSWACLGQRLHTGDHRYGNKRNNAKFQTCLVFSPCPPLVSVRGYENGGVVNSGARCRTTGRSRCSELRLHVAADHLFPGEGARAAFPTGQQPQDQSAPPQCFTRRGGHPC